MDNTFISAYQQTLQQLKDLFSQRAPISVKKGEIFVNYGEKNQHLGILLSGLMYASYFSEEGKEWISRFFYTPQNSIVCSYETFITGNKSAEIIRAYEDTELICFSKKEYENIINKNPELERMTRIMAEESYILALKRIHDLQSLSASQRVKKFMDEHRGIVNRVQRQHVASYLGIHRNIFTRILSNL